MLQCESISIRLTRHILMAAYVQNALQLMKLLVKKVDAERKTKPCIPSQVVALSRFRSQIPCSDSDLAGLFLHRLPLQPYHTGGHLHIIRKLVEHLASRLRRCPSSSLGNPTTMPSSLPWGVVLTI
jgi:hypothetical protein